MTSKLLTIIILSLGFCSCNMRIADFRPNHLGIAPSIEWEIQEGHEVKHKPKIHTSLDWNF